jgi:DNA-binding transcriptional LysR family regulator
MRPDLNLLVTLDVLLAEGNVARAAERLQLSPSAMSRALARLRKTTGDPLLARAGRGLVPTPRAIELRDRVARLVQDAEAALRPAEALDFRGLDRTFTLRTSDGFAENFAPRLIDRLHRDAPKVRLRFLLKSGNKDESAALRDGTVDLETGVIGRAASTAGRPEIRTQALFRDHFVAVVHHNHPLANHRKLTPARYATQAGHILVSRRPISGGARGPIDKALHTLGLDRDIAITVGGFAAAISLARITNYIATVPDRHTAVLRQDLHTFPLPFEVPEITVSMQWHPRLDADPSHRWLRACLKEICK